MSKYAGITIGPIFDTIMDASSPAALWFASSIFSDITRRLCEKIYEKYVKKEDGKKRRWKKRRWKKRRWEKRRWKKRRWKKEEVILSPYYSKNIKLSDGVGKFHDRIIFQAPEITVEQLKEITAQVKKEIMADFPDWPRKQKYIDFLNTYLQIHYCIIPAEEIGNENCILALSPYLDALEVMKTFNVTDAGNPFTEMFRNDNGGRNAMIKKSPLFTNIREEGNQFKNKDEDIRSIEEISEGSNAVANYSDLKMSRYFAVVSADGDHMTDYLTQLDSSEKIKAFSKACLEYDEAAANMVGRYGGMTIYAGGDDLLFLAPLKGASEKDASGKNIFSLCSEINDKFHEFIGKEPELKDIDSSTIPHISFGISIQYQKFPLYEARANARHLLDDIIKEHQKEKKDPKKRNSMAIELRKHSGQSVVLRISNKRQEMFQQFLAAGKDTEFDTVGTMRIVEDYREVLRVLDETAQSERQFMDAWKNFYDNAGQKPAESFSNEIGTLYYQNFVADREKIQDDIEIPDSEENTPINQLLAMLALRRFAQEKADKKERDQKE